MPFIGSKVIVKLLKNQSTKITKNICSLYRKEFNIPQNNIYLQYEEMYNWGFEKYSFK